MNSIPSMPDIHRQNEGTRELSWQQFKRRVYLAVGLITFLIVFASFVSVTVNLLLLLFLCILLAIGLRGLSRILTQHTLLDERVALALVVVLLLGTIVGIGFLVGPRLADQFNQLSQTLPESYSRLQAELRRYAWGQQLLDQMPSLAQLGTQVIGGADQDIFARITGVVSSVLSILSSLLVALFITLYLAIEPQTYVRNFLHLVPQERRERVRETLAQTAKTLRQWLLTRVVSMCVVASLTFIGLSVIGMPLVLSLTLLAAIGAFIPTFGPILALIPAVLVALIQGPQQVLYVTVLYVGVQMIDNYLVSPILQKSVLYLPPAYIVVTQLLLGVIAGSFGLVLAAPLAAALVVVVRNLYVEDVLGDEVRSNGKT